MSELPKGWAESELAALGSWSSGGTPSRIKPEFFGTGVPWIKSGDLPDGPVTRTSEQITLLGLANSAAKLLPMGTVSIALYGATIGKLGVLTFPAATNQACANVIPHKSLVGGRYLFYVLLAARKDLIALGQGGAQPNISQDIVKSYEVRLAPPAEQRRIVAKLDALLARVDVCRQRLDKVPKLLARFRQSVLAAACSGRLTEDWHKEADPSDSAWQELRVRELLASPLANGRSVPDGDGFPVLRLTCLKNGRIDLSERKTGAWSAEEAKRFAVERGDFLVSRGNGSLAFVGRGGLVIQEPDPVAYPDTLIRLRPSREIVDSAFLALVWNTPIVRSQIESAAHTTAGIWKISQGDIEGFALPIPTPAEQHEIVRRVDQLFAFADRLEARVQNARKRVDALTQSILAKAFRGELVPTEAELAEAEGPPFESAEQLLSRIRSEREPTPAPTPRKRAPSPRAARA